MQKYAATLPDTVLPPPSNAAASNGNTPRMGTPANEGASWAGWAISSFTNKLTAANGQMNVKPSANGSRVTSPEPRPNSVPATMSGRSKPSTTAPLVSSSLKPTTSSALKPTASNPFAPSPSTDANDDEDFDAGWGDADEDNAADAWGAADPFSSPPAASASEPNALFDDKGEPDFSGWLNAQADAKKKVKNPLPKGLAKTSAAAARPGLGAKSNSTGTAAVGKNVLPVAKKKEEVKKDVMAEDDDAWGDAW